MSSLSKPKYTSGLNIYSLSKMKEMGAKIKTVHLNEGHFTGNLNNLRNTGESNSNLSQQGNQNSQNTVNINSQTHGSNPMSHQNNAQNSNSFRQTGIFGVKKFKTTKSSPEKHIDRKFSGDKSKLLVQNFMKNSVSNSIGGAQHISHGSTLINNPGKHSVGPTLTPAIDENSEISYNVLDFITKKLNKKSDNSNKKSSVLNSTNPINNKKIVESLITGKCTPLFQKSQKVDQKVEENHKTNTSSLYLISGSNMGNAKLNIAKSNSHINDDKVAINVSEDACESKYTGTKVSSPRYDGMLKKYYDININEANKKLDSKSQSHNKGSASMKKIQTNNNINTIITGSSHGSSLLKYSVSNTANNSSLNKYITKIATTSELKKKTTPVLNENIAEAPHTSIHTPKNADSISGHSKQNSKISATTPVTGKNSRKNSSEKREKMERNNPVSNNYIKSSSNKPGISSQQHKAQTRLGSATNSHYVTNNSNMSNNNSLSNLTNNSTSKFGVSNIIVTPNHQINNPGYEEINLVTDNSLKKSQKVISTSTVKTNLLKGPNALGTNPNSLSGSQNFSNNLIFDIVQGNMSKMSKDTLKKKPSIGVSLPVTNQASKKNSQNNSKSTSRIDDKTETVRKNVAEAETKKNWTQGHHLNLNTAININEKFNYKKHLTSTNSPTHFPFNFNKDKLNTKSAGTNSIGTVGTNSQTKNSNSLSKPKDEAVSIKNKPVMSLKLNLSGNMSGEPSKKNLQIATTHPNNSGATLSKNNSKANQVVSEAVVINKMQMNNNQQTNKISKPKEGNKGKSDVNTNTNAIQVPNNTDYNINIDVSGENLLDNSTSSIKSTMRESNYYRREAEKIANFIKNFYASNGEYPQTSLKFYKFGRLLGRGAFGKVNLCLHTVSGRLVAVKSFNKSMLTSENAKRKIFHETNLMKHLKHNSIVKIFEVIESPKYILIVMEYICGGDLLSFVRKRTKLNEATSKFIFRQIIEALQYIHSQNIIHRDIKLDNILIDLGNNIKICDFGVGRMVRNGDLMHDQCGTPAYIAPEILRNNGYEGFGVDLWSAGVVLYAMLSGTVPFKATNMADLHLLIISGNYAPIKDISSEAADLLAGILHIDPKKRLTIDQILSHEWLRSTDEMFNGKMKTLSKLNLNLFTNAERILLSKSNIDYRTANKDDILENFTLRNLDTNQESENQNVGTKSYILAPFNSSLKNIRDFRHPGLKVENDVLKFCGKAKEANRIYELNNNEEIDNGILINIPKNEVQLINSVDKEENVNTEKDRSGLPSSKMSKLASKQVSKPNSPPEFNKDGKVSSVPSPREDSHRNSRKNMKDLSIMNANTFVLDENVVKMLENIGYKKDYLLKCLCHNELNYATAAYYLLLNSSMD